MRRIVFVAALLTMAIGLGCSSQETSSRSSKNKETTRIASPAGEGQGGRKLPPPGRPLIGQKPPMPASVQVSSPSGYRVQTIASGLVVPWDMVFVSRQRIYVTERPGRVRLIENGRLRSSPYAVIKSARSGEGGLMGIALHPNYPNPAWVYLMYTYSSGIFLYDRISYFLDTGNGLTNEKPVVTRIAAATYHDGGIIRFGPDGMLYAGTGDAGQPESAQDRSSLSGKVLRMTPTGKVPADNPFSNSLVYAYGLRNVQGFAWNPANGDLWVTNHGPSGEFGLEAMDSVFIIPRGGNCGWPRTLGVTDVRGVVPPVLWYPGTAVPPALAVFYTSDQMPNLRGNFFFASLRGEHLQRVILSGPRTISRIERWFQTGTHKGRYGRLRAVVQGPDGALYVSTSNRDGRGSVRPGDDRILRITRVSGR
ncbi:MAG: PQQ-dependent sugar dehydrogenase [Armatimonadota bacterium]|nr:PQQ-dependent sugar dehydrogenase [bacterium]